MYSDSVQNILDFLKNVGEAETLDEFKNNVLSHIGEIFPFDCYSLFFEITRNGTFMYEGSKGNKVPSKTLESFNNYFYKIPPPSLSLGKPVHAVHWDDFRHTEYVTDFIKPQRIADSASMIFYNRYSLPEMILAIHRSASTHKITEKEMEHLEFAYQQLNVMYRLHKRIEDLETNHFLYVEVEEAHKLLSKREREITSLLCKRMTAPEIAERLSISSRTVETHIEHIYNKIGVYSRKELLQKLMNF